MTDDWDGLDLVWNWIVSVFSNIGEVAVKLWDWIETWPLPVRLVAGGALGMAVLIGLAKR